MRTRQPASRATRIWLLRRLAVARRGRDVLEQKQRALRRDVERLAELADAARLEWETTAREAELWWQRAAVLAGERPLALARETSRAPAEVTLAWRNTLGVRYPADAAVRLPGEQGVPAGGSAAL